MESIHKHTYSEMIWFSFESQFCGCRIASWNGVCFVRLKYALSLQKLTIKQTRASMLFLENDFLSIFRCKIQTPFQEMVSQIFRRKTIIANYGRRKPIHFPLCATCVLLVANQLPIFSTFFPLLSISFLYLTNWCCFHCFFAQNSFAS